MTDEQRRHWLRQAVGLAVENVRSRRGGPFGAIIVQRGQIIATGVNLVTSTNDPTAHAEVVAIRAACHELGTFQLPGCDIYLSCEPCPMCLGALYWARPKSFYYAATRHNAAQAGFDDDFIYRELLLAPGKRSIPGHRLGIDSESKPFEEWARSLEKVRY